MKTYKQILGEALIKVGLGLLGGGFISAIVSSNNWLLLIASIFIGSLLIHIGAILSSGAKNETSN